MTRRDAWLALAAVTPLSMLITYHRPWDAKLLLLAIPACAILWAEGGRLRWPALTLTAAAMVFTGDIPLKGCVVLGERGGLGSASGAWRLLTLLCYRPASVALLAVGVFYLWVFLRSGKEASKLRVAKPA
jgi:hypothetical protein